MEVARTGRSAMAGDLHLGVIPTVGPFLLPRVLPALRERFPDLTVYLREEQTGRMLRRLEDGELDAVLMALPCATGDLAVEEILEDEFLFACHRSHPLADRDAVPLESLAGERLLLLEEGHCLRGHALDACRLGDRRARTQFEASSLHTLVQMVAAGIGVTLLPRIAVDAQVARGTGISISRLAGPASRRVGLAWRRTSPRDGAFRLLAGALRELTVVA